MALSEEDIQKLLEAMADEDGPSIEKARFAPLQPTQVPGASTSYEFIGNVTLRLTTELGRTRLKIKEILELQEGSVITLNKLVGEPLEIFINDIPLASGEVVVINDAFGIRINNLARKERKEEKAQDG